MAWIQKAGQICRLSCQHQSMTCLQRHKSVSFLRRCSPLSLAVQDVHIFTTCHRQTFALLNKTNLQRESTFKFLNQHFSRTFSSLSKGRHIIYSIRPLQFTIRYESRQSGAPSNRNQSALIYIVAIFIFMIGAAYAGVPLYKVFCQATGLGGQAISKGHETEKIESMKKVDRQIKIRFNADVASSMRWNFRPQQTEVTVLPGETALAFYTAMNPTDKPIIGISTYNVLPYDAGQYFNKIQCFCFEEQRLNPKEQVDMPVFFYIDPEFAEDPKLENVRTITLSYTFFEAKEGLQLPLPGYPQPHDPVVST